MKSMILEMLFMSKIQKIFFMVIWNLGSVFLCFIRFELLSILILLLTLALTPVVIKKLDDTLIRIQNKYEKKKHSEQSVFSIEGYITRKRNIHTQYWPINSKVFRQESQDGEESTRHSLPPFLFLPSRNTLHTDQVALPIRSARSQPLFMH